MFSQKDMRDKYAKEFGALLKQTNEIDSFNDQYKQLKKLWTNKLSTPLEEVLSMQESLVKLRASTNDLSQKLQQKEDAFMKFQETTKEQKEQRHKELEDLNTMQTNKKTERKTKEDDLLMAAEITARHHKDEHMDRSAGLKKTIAEL